MAQQTSEAFVRAKLVVQKRREYEETYETAPRSVRSLARVAFTDPYVTVSEAAELIGMTYQSANNAVDRLVADGVLVEITGKAQNRAFKAAEVMDIVERPPAELPDPADVIDGASVFDRHSP